MTGEDFAPFLKKVADSGTLSAVEAESAFERVLSGTVSDAQLSAFLALQAQRGASQDEILGATRAMRAKMRTIEAPEGTIDLCGTGGDGHGTLNISTAASFVVAATGVPVAKHGNRNMSSKSGAADVLERLGVKINLEPHAAEKCLADTGLCFLFAQTYHPALKQVAPMRRALGFRTIFNVLGPLCSPARVERQLIGVYSRSLAGQLPDVLRQLGTKSAWIVHGEDGLDELTTTTTTRLASLTCTPTCQETKIGVSIDSELDAGLPRATLADLKGGDAEENAVAMRNLFDGERGAYRDIVLLNSAAALIVAGKVTALRDGVALAAEALDSGAAKAKLGQLIAVSNA